MYYCAKKKKNRDHIERGVEGRHVLRKITT